MADWGMAGGGGISYGATVNPAARAVLQRSRAVVTALAADDTVKLAAYIHPQRGARCCPGGFSLNAPLWTARQVAALHGDGQRHVWGRVALNGQPCA